MIEIFKTDDVSKEVIKIDQIEKRCWINITAPSEEELKYIENNLDIEPDFLRDPLDEEEKPRIDVENNQTLIIVDIPYVYEGDKNLRFETLPMGILVLKEHILTICLKDNHIIDLFRTKKVKDFYTFMKTRFTLQMLFIIAKEFLKYLKHIDKKTDDIEKTLHKSMKNKELLKLLELQKTLVFFTTSLKSNEIVMEKLLRGKYIKMYEEDQDLLEDVIIENKQAIEMSNIYTSILHGMMEAFGSVISNNLNNVMKSLTSVTVVMAIPTMIASFWGMNVYVPWMTSPYAFTFVLAISITIAVFSSIVLYKRSMF